MESSPHCNRWIPFTKGRQCGDLGFLYCKPEQSVEKVELPMSRDTMTLTWRHINDKIVCQNISMCRRVSVCLVDMTSYTLVGNKEVHTIRKLTCEYFFESPENICSIWSPSTSLHRERLVHHEQQWWNENMLKFSLHTMCFGISTKWKYMG